MAIAEYTESFLEKLDHIAENYKLHLIDEGEEDILAEIQSDELYNNVIYHCEFEAQLPFIRTREYHHPIRKSKFDCILAQLQLRSRLIPPLRKENEDIDNLKYFDVFHASQKQHNQESLSSVDDVDNLFEDE